MDRHTLQSVNMSMAKTRFTKCENGHGIGTCTIYTKGEYGHGIGTRVGIGIHTKREYRHGIGMEQAHVQTMNMAMI